MIFLGTIEDIHNFDSLAKEHWKEFNKQEPCFNKEILGHFPVIICKEDNNIVGYVFFLVFNSPYYAEKWAQVDMFYLKPEYRHKGIGTKMFNMLIDLVKSEGCKRVISSYNNKKPLASFYDNLGFSSTHVAVAKEI